MSGLLLLLACGGGLGGPVGDDDFTEDEPFGPGGTAACGQIGNLEIVPLDIWGQDLAQSSLSMDFDPTTVPSTDLGPGVTIIRYGEVAADLQIRIESEDHDAIDFVAEYDGSGGFLFTTPDEGRLASSAEIRQIGEDTCPVTTVYAGLDHRWFASTGRTPSNNTVELLMDGEEFWVSVSDALDASRDRVSWTTWWWMSEFEMVRPEGVYNMSDSQRWKNTVMGQLEEMSGVERRLLINRFWDENSDWLEYLNTDTELRDVARATGDDFEVILQGNPTEVSVFDEYSGEPADFDFAVRVSENARYSDRALGIVPKPHPIALSLQIASYHQKGMVMDGQVAFVTGMNTKSTDWDTNEHLVYDPRRMDYDADQDDRLAVANGEEEPDLGPRKDYGVRIEGPAARDVEEVIWERWEAGIDGDDLYAENATRFSLSAPAAEPAGGVPTQVVATMPEPWAEMSIMETHARAIRAAESYILIEDQYFRSPRMTEVLIQAMDANPELVLVVVTMAVSESDGGAKYTYLGDAALRERYPDRYLLLQLVTADLYLDEGTFWDTVELVAPNMDTHSKLRLIDDRYLSVGSCNYNNRGYLYEGELNVSVLDEGVGTAARKRILENYVGSDWKGYLSDDPWNNLDVLAMAAESNREILDWWEDNADDFDVDEAVANWAVYRPSGFVVPLEISADYDFDVGPDAF